MEKKKNYYLALPQNGKAVPNGYHMIMKLNGKIPGER